MFDYYLSDAPSISVTLSKRNKIYESALLFPFFLRMSEISKELYRYARVLFYRKMLLIVTQRRNYGTNEHNANAVMVVVMH